MAGVVLNKEQLFKELNDIKDVKAKTAFNNLRADLATKVPTLAGQIASSYYDMGPRKLNPNNKNSLKGHVSANGGTVMGLTFVYKGPRLHVGSGGSGASFKLTPKAHGKRAYKMRGHILKGRTSPYGHYSKPYSEGGKYGPRSPFMLLPGVGVPIRRNGRKWTEVALGLSVPQMVVSVNTEDKLKSEINDLMYERLKHHMQRLLSS